MCKGCELTRDFERIIQEQKLMVDGTFPTPEGFDAVINAAANLLTHIASTMPDRNARRAFLSDVNKKLDADTKRRVNGGPFAPLH